MTSADRNYFLARAEAELDRGNAAACADTARAHYQLAAIYLDRARGGADNDD